MLPLLLLLAIPFASPAAAQTGRAFVTVDALVAGSDAVYSGSIKSLEHKPNDYRRDCHVIVHVDEVLKGPPKKELELTFTTNFPEAFLAEMTKNQLKFLWVPNRAKNGYEPLGNDLSRKLGYPGGGNQSDMVGLRLWDRNVERFADFDHNVFTADLRVISTWDDLLKEARLIAKRHPGPAVDLTYFAPPNSVSRICGDPNAYAAVLVPKVPETEVVARKLIANPEGLVATAIKKSRRVEQKPELSKQIITDLQRAGIGLLAEFPSDDNRKLLKSLRSEEKFRNAVEHALEKMGGSTDPSTDDSR